MSSLEYDGRLTPEAAKNDNALAESAWCRIWPGLSARLFGGVAWEKEDFGSIKDKFGGIDGYTAEVAIGRRLQIMDGRVPYNSFTIRPSELRKLFERRNITKYQLQAYLKHDWDSDLATAGCVETTALITFIEKYLNPNNFKKPQYQ